jgi:GH25 family lysozyme M1 (1,4-beta-N-acetylmuramidase)
LAVLAIVGAALGIRPVLAGPSPDGTAGSSGTAGSAGPPLAGAQPPDSLPGIDVSHYQETIDWTKVAASGRRFAIAKATDGRSFIDPMYATNKAEAMAAGLVFGAYHFARPDGSANDAVLEADHFVDVAQLGQGNLVPVLDLERTGDLTPEQLIAWMLAWLGEVTARTGVRPMIYTSPHGWDSRTDDSTAIVDAGYTVLWIAHWGVDTPTLPANDWQGFGWMFWQHSNCGSVPGIQGCVDSDWFNGLTFDAVTIPSPDTTPPTAALSVPPGVSGPVDVRFSEIVRDVTSDNVTLRVLDTGEHVPSTLACASKDGRVVDCATGKIVTVTLQPIGPLIPGQTYAATVNPPEAPAPVVDRSDNAAPTTEQSFGAPTEIEQGSEAITYGWRTVAKAGTYGGSFASDHLAGATASFTFSGKKVTWFTVAGPSYGKASVWIDGHAEGTFNQYAPSVHTKVARSFTGLAPGPHTITVRVLGRRGSLQATDAQVALDAFQGGGRIWWTPPLRTTWQRADVGGASGGDVAVSDQARTTVALTFRGSGVRWQTVRGPDQGRAQIFVDGALVKTVDNYAATTTTGVLRSITGLAVGIHELLIVATGEARPASHGTKVSVDRFSILA